MASVVALLLFAILTAFPAAATQYKEGDEVSGRGPVRSSLHV